MSLRFIRLSQSRGSAVCSMALFTVACFAVSIFAFPPSTVFAQAVAEVEPETEVEGEVESESESAKSKPTQSEAAAAILERVTYDIKYMASDELGGRQPGTPEMKLCEDYIVGEYKKIGLVSPMEDGSYFQTFEVGKTRKFVADDSGIKLMGPNDAEMELAAGADYTQMTCRKDFDMAGELVFVGYGINADEEHNYNDYEGIDVEGKVVVLIRREPQQENAASVFDGEEITPYSYIRTKVVAARDAKAAGVLMVNDGLSSPDEDRDELLASDQCGSDTNSIPFAQIKRSALNKILELSPLSTPTGEKLETLEAIEAHIDDELEPVSQTISGWKISMKGAFEDRGIETSNIVGVIEGEGPNAHETIVIGGHYDHLGKGAYGSRAQDRFGEIHNGADDNATGTAGVIELARRYAARDEKPGRRLVFVCFTAEEMGLLGAYHYVQNPIYPLEDTVAMVNYDMIGWLRDDKLTLYGWNSSKQFDALFEAANEGFDLDLQKPASGFAGSDHLPFNEKRIPNTFIHTGINDVYHTPDDDFEAIDCEGAVKVIDFTEKFVDGLAAMEKRPKYGMPKPFRLGVLARANDNGEFVFQRISTGSIAESAGLQEGDVLVSWTVGDEEHEISSQRQLRRAIRRDRGETVKMKLLRDDAEVLLNVLLANPDEDEDEDE